MQALLIANPTSGQLGRQSIEDYVRLALFGIDSQVHWTNNPGHARQILQDLRNTKPIDLIAVAGGDGTLNEAANGLLHNTALTHRPAIAILPTGTSNILANELGLANLNPHDLNRIIHQKKTTLVDVGVCSDRYFLLMAGFGFDAETVKNVLPELKATIGSPAYFVSAIKSLVGFRGYRLRIEMDGATIDTDTYLTVITNVSAYALGNIKIAPYASFSDGWLDICIFEKAKSNIVGFVAQSFKALSSKHIDDPNVRYFRSKNLRITTFPTVQCQIDGDLYGATPVEITIRPKALEFIVNT